MPWTNSFGCATYSVSSQIGCSDDVYTPEVERIHAELDNLSRGEAKVERLIEIFGAVYKRRFTLSDDELRTRYPQFEEIAQNVMTYWG